MEGQRAARDQPRDLLAVGLVDGPLAQKRVSLGLVDDDL
jgi:hypothetical protein